MEEVVLDLTKTWLTLSTRLSTQRRRRQLGSGQVGLLLDTNSVGRCPAATVLVE